MKEKSTRVGSVKEASCVFLRHVQKNDKNLRNLISIPQGQDDEITFE